MSGLIPTSTIDLLDEDKALRGQNYACVSFLSPEQILADKDVFMFNRFIEGFARDMDTFFQGMIGRYPDDAITLKAIRETNSHIFNGKDLQDQYSFYKSANSQSLEEEFHAANEFRTSMRAIKIRGVFDTLREAQLRAEVLKRMGDKFDIFVCQVGVWCPWSPNPDDLLDQQYSETQINTLMSEYKKNASLKDEFFEKRKKEKLEDAMLEKDVWTKRKEAEGGPAFAVDEAAPEPMLTSQPSTSMP